MDFTHQSFCEMAATRLIVRGKLLLLPEEQRNLLFMATIADGKLFEAICVTGSDKEGIWMPHVECTSGNVSEGEVQVLFLTWQHANPFWKEATAEMGCMYDAEHEHTQALPISSDAFLVPLCIAFGSLVKGFPDNRLCARLLALIYRLQRERARVLGLPSLK